MPLRTAALGALAAFIAIVAVQHAVAPELEPDRHTISEYANGASGWLMVAGFLLWASSLALSAVLAFRARSGRRLALGALGVLLVIAAMGIVVTGCFATQTSAGVLPPGVARSTSGRLHDLGSGLAMLALLVAALVSLWAVESPPGFRRSTVPLLALAVVSAAALLFVGEDVAGIRQRVLVAAEGMWQAGLVVALAAREGEAHQTTE